MVFTCYICCEEQPNKYKIVCPKCNDDNLEYCKVCLKRYLMDSKSTDVSCIHPECDLILNTDFLYTVMGKHFIDKVYRPHKAEILFNHEKAYLPQTQLVLEREREKDKIKAEIAELDDKIRLLGYEKNRLRQQMYDMGGNTAEVKAKATNFIGHCPYDDCKGYLDTNHHCKTCDKVTCAKCLKPKHKDKCNKDDVDTASLLAKNTKPCPKCSVPIFKVSGCDQMYCVKCHTAFSWKTGNIVSKGAIHNPHYYEFIRQNPDRVDINNQVVDQKVVDQKVVDQKVVDQKQNIRCRNFPTLNAFLTKIPTNDRNYWIDIFRNILDICFDKLPEYRRKVHWDPDRNQDLRLKYLKNNIDEAKIMKLLTSRYKTYEKNTSIVDCFQTFYDVIRTIIHRFIDGGITYETMKEHLNELRDFINKSFERLAYVYTPTVPQIGENFSFITRKFK